MLMQANQRVYLFPSGKHLDGHALMPLAFGEDCIGLGENSSSFTTEFGGWQPPWWPIQPQKCSCRGAVSVGMSKVMVPGLSFGKGTAFCLLAPGPQGSISSFQPQTRGSANERSEETSQRCALGHTK